MRKLALLAAAALFLAPPVLAQTQQQRAQGTAGSTYTGNELETALRGRSIPTLGPTVVAMVKDSREGSIAVAVGSCDTPRWVELPTAAIAEAQLVGTVPCRDQRHPLVSIRLAPAEDKTARAIAELLSETIANICPFGPLCPPLLYRTRIPGQ